ncbi:MAG: rRNA maturation RNase YbeY [Gemmatimonadota bacterium]|nr:rRNA maturation RNase YbeY [Gemmatimonadota bacterium]
MITVHVNAPDGIRVPGLQIDRALRATLRREGVSRAELSVTFVSDAKIAELHGRYLGRPGVTDVLAFALHQDGEDPLGDVYVGHAQALRQAAEAGAEADEELLKLAVHGTLHVLGYDHPDGPERVRCEMYRVQEAVLRGLAAELDKPSPAAAPVGEVA